MRLETRQLFGYTTKYLQTTGTTGLVVRGDIVVTTLRRFIESTHPYNISKLQPLDGS